MLNPNLKLNHKLFDDGQVEMATRDGFGDGLIELALEDSRVMVLTADLCESTRVEAFAKKFPGRFIECGVAEQNMIGIASGLAVSGKVPFATSYANFSPGKNWETIRTTVVYNKANVKIAGHHSGIMTGPDGVTHQSTEDIALTRSWPGITILSPSDYFEAKKSTIHSAKIEGPVYLRLGKNKTRVITTAETPFDGKIYEYWTTDKPEVAIMVTGYPLWFALQAAKELESEGVKVVVANVPTIKPMDIDNILRIVEKSGAVVSVEDHQVMGGMGSAIAEVLAQKKPVPMEFVGLQDTFAESGSFSGLIEKYGLSKKTIIEAVLKVRSRKK